MAMTVRRAPWLVALAIALMASEARVPAAEATPPAAGAPQTTDHTPSRLSFRTVGFYGVQLDFADFAFLKFSFNKPQDKAHLAALNALLRQAHQAGQLTIVGLYTFDRVSHSKPVSEYVANTDALLSGLDRSLIYAVCPSEENVTWNHGTEVLNALYDTITSKWHLPCYQWLSMPYPPQAQVKADGWILDAYGYDYAKFRRHLVKFLLTGKPVVVCVNATAPGGKYAAEKLVPDEPGSPAEAQMRICREFDVPVFFYAVDRRWGNVHAWLRDTDEETIRCRRWALQWVDRAHSLPPTRQPPASAQFLAARPMEVCGGKDNTFSVTFDFSDTTFANRAGLEGLLNLRWDGAAKKVRLVAGPGEGPPKARLYWHLTAPLPMRDLT
ncbi:MAG: hypothetical protein J7M26_05250, partial [Armatimonadetes bacterium]|nr:hypothetical protein [Armatimonadota bacterium]